VSPVTLVVVTIAAFLASLLTLFSGFGLGTLLMPVVAVFFPVPVAVALTALVHLLNNLFKLAVLWRDIDWAVTWHFGVPALLATVPGAWLLGRLATLPPLTGYSVGGVDASVTPIKLTVGLLLIAFACAEWFSLDKRIELSRRLLPAGGVLSGFFGGLSGHQGAFRSAFLVHAGLDARRFIATNAAIASLVDVTRLLVYGLSLTLVLRQVDGTVIAAAAVAAFAGVLAGRLGIEKVTIGAIQRLVAVMLLCLGMLLVAGIL
jgi:uncharacterized membrane protein YfcA